MTLEEAFALGEANCNRRDILLLLEEATGWTQTQLRMNMTLDSSRSSRSQHPIPTEATQKFLHMLEQRQRHVPVQYILKQWEFMGLPMYCSGVLIPRPDTEVLVEQAVSFLQNFSTDLEMRPVQVLDICTGSGCIAIALAHFCRYIRNMQVTAVDIDSHALSVAQKNAIFNNVAVAFLCSDLLAEVNGQFDCITANPPYIPTRDIDDLAEEVRLHEPLLALDGGVDGLDFYRRIIPACKGHLRANGAVFLEIGVGQAEAVANMFCEQEFSDVEVITDLLGRARVVRAFAR